MPPIGGKKPKTVKPKPVVPVKKPPERALNPRQQSAADQLKRTVPGVSGVQRGLAGQQKPAGRYDAKMKARLDRIFKGYVGPDGKLTKSWEQWVKENPKSDVEDMLVYRRRQQLEWQSGVYNDPVSKVIRNIAGAERSAIGAITGSSSGASTNHVDTQTAVGGTTGSKEVIDRSEAVRKSWDTRRKLYGSSGQKEK